MAIFRFIGQVFWHKQAKEIFLKYKTEAVYFRMAKLMALHIKASSERHFHHHSAKLDTTVALLKAV